jgi:iron complex outermembrane receptor protein
VFWERQDYLLADIDRIEVISGPGGTLWGANAVNGVINIITKSASETRGTYLEAGAGNQLEDAAAFRYGADLGPDGAFRVYGKYFNRDDEPRADGSPNRDSWHKAQAGFRFDAASSPNDAWTVQGDYYSGDEGIATGRAAHISGANLLAHWTHASSADTTTNVQAYYDRTHLSDPVPPLVLNSIPLAPAGVLVDDLDTWDVDFDQSLRLGERHRLVWGLGLRHTHDVVSNSPGLAFLPTQLDQDLYSAFVQDDWTVRDGLVVTAGTKLEHNDYTGLEVQPNARVQWNFAPDHLLWAAMSRAVRTPSRVDRDVIEPLPPAPLILLEGSPDFVSETVIAHELGYRAQFGSDVTASISAFYNVYDDVRSTSPNPATIIPFVFRNELEGDTWGVELSANWQLRDWWRLHGGLVVLEESIRIEPGGSDLNAGHNETADPEHWATLRSSMDFPHALQLDADLRCIGRRNINSGPTVGPVPGYTEVDVRLGWHASANLELSLVGQNLLHARHPEYGFPSPDRPEIARSVFGKLVWQF